MTDTNDLLQQIRKIVREEVKAETEPINKRLDRLEQGQEGLQAEVKGLNAEVKGLNAGQETLDLKIEAIHVYQKNAHTEIMNSLVESNEINSQEMKELEKRVKRLEEHTGLAKPHKN